MKARFRRAQAFQKLCRLDQAFLDAQRCAQVEPKNKTFHDLLRQLGAQIQQKVMHFEWMMCQGGLFLKRCPEETVAN